MTATPVSTSADVVRNVVKLLIACGDVAAANDGGGGTMRIFHGEEYVDQNDTPPRIVFILGEESGELGGVLEVGARQVASWGEVISAHVWGAGPSDDARLDDALARSDRLINAFKATVGGRLRGRRWTREQTPRKLKHGEEVMLAITYSRPVPYADDIFAAAYALAPAPPYSPANPDQPNGPTGLEYDTTPITLANGRPS